MSPIALELATAYVSIVPSTDKIAPGLRKAMGGSAVGRAAEDSGRSFGSRMSSGIGRTLKGGALVAGGAVAGILGAALVKGFGRLNAIEQAEAKLKGLGHSAGTVTGIMENALASVKGTAFGLDEAATTAAGAVAAGIKPGKELERILGLTGDTATIAGTSMGEMGSIFNKVAASNRVSMQEVNQLSDRGVPIMQMLADQYGVTAGEARKMVERGEVDFADFSKAIETNIAGAALKSGDTVSGSFKNMGAALGRVGAQLMSGVFPELKGGFSGITEGLDKLGPLAEKAGRMLGAGITRAGDAVVGFVAEFKKGEGAGGRFRDMLTRVRDGLGVAFGYVRSSVIPTLKSFGGFLYRNREAVIAVVGGLALGLAGLKAFMFIKNVTIAVRAFSAVLAANPIGALIVVIGLLVGAFVLLYRKNETARKIMDKAWAGIKSAVSGVVSWFRGTAWPWMRDALGAIGSKVMWLWNNVTKPYLGFIWALSKSVFGWVKNTGWPWMRDAFKLIGGAAKYLWTNFVKPFFGKILKDVKDVSGWVKNTAYPRFRDAFKLIGSKAKALWNDGIKPAFNGIRDTVSTVWDKVKKVFDKFKSGIRSVKDAFGDAKAGIGRVWDGIVSTITKPINKVIGAINKFTGGLEKAINKIPGVNIDIGTISKIGIPAPRVSNNGSRGGSSRGGNGAQYLATGGPIRGFSPGGIKSKIDNIPIMARAKEWIINQGSSMRMERDNPGALAFINRTGRLPGFARGGPVGGNLADSLGDLARGAFDILTDPKKAFKNLLNKALGGLGKSLPVTIAKGALSGVPEGLGGWLKKQMSASVGGGSYSDKGGSWQKIVGLIRAAGFSPSITSTVRRSGGRTLTGKMSRHGLGKAVDMRPDKGIQDFLWGIKNSFRELYMPDGRGWLLGKPRSAYPGARATMANHMGGNAHIHAAYADGGMVRPFVADSGAVLAPGLNVLDNRTGGPEPLGRTDQMGPMAITSGWLEIRGDGMARIVDGRIERADNYRGVLARQGVKRG